MKGTILIARLALTSALLIGSVGCATVDKHIETRSVKTEESSACHAYKQWPFGQHPNPGVGIPARVGGATTTAFIGFPAVVALIPVTATIAGAEDSNLFPLVPLLLCYVTGDTVFGAIAWPFFGWWHMPNEHGCKPDLRATAAENTSVRHSLGSRGRSWSW